MVAWRHCVVGWNRRWPLLMPHHDSGDNIPMNQRTHIYICTHRLSFKFCYCSRIAGFLTTARAEQLLMSQLDGTFLLRFSLSEPGELVCAVKSDNAVHSFYILADFEELNDRNLCKDLKKKKNKKM